MESGIATLGVFGNYGFTVNVDTKTEQWQLWVDNAVQVL